MNETDIIERVVSLESWRKTCDKRLDKIDKSNEALTEMAASIKLLAYQQGESNKKIDAIDHKVSALEAEPGTRWKSLIGYVIAAICSAGVGALITYLFG